MPTPEANTPMTAALRVLLDAIDRLPVTLQPGLYDAAEGIVNAQAAMIMADIKRTLDAGVA